MRAIGPEEWEPWLAASASAFGEYPNRTWLELERKIAEFDRTLGVLEGGRFVAGASAASMRITVPGGEVPMAGLTGLGVAPTHRRRGIATALVRLHFDDVRERGDEPVSGLWASESHIYSRFGYGVAVPRASIDIERERSAFSFPFEERGRVRLLDRGQAFEAYPQVYDGVRRSVPGMPERIGAWWDVRFGDPEDDREGASAYFYAVHEGMEGADAYAVYRVKHDWSQGVPSNEVQVEELMGATPEAYAGIWRFVFDLDLTARITAWNRPVDEPLWHMVAEPRRLRLQVRDGMWVRIVDVQRALTARRYGVHDRLAIEIRDPFLPENEGTYVLEGGPEGATCGVTRDPPDLVVRAEDLAACYLGWARFGQLARAGRLAEETTGAVARADAMFAHDPAPWCPHAF